MNRLLRVLILISGVMLSACQTTKTVAEKEPKPSPKQSAEAAQKPWYESAMVFEQQPDRYQALGTAISLDSTIAKTKARHTSIAILQSKLQEILEGMRNEMVENGVDAAKEPLYILQTRTCLNNLYKQLPPDKTMIQPRKKGYKAYVMMHMDRAQLWDDWKKSLATNHAWLQKTSASPVVRSWLHPDSKKSIPNPR